MGRATTEALPCLAHHSPKCDRYACGHGCPLCCRRGVRTAVQRPGAGSLRLVPPVASSLMGLLAACASHIPRLSATQQAMQYKDNASGDYTPPGPPSDPWGPYIAEASHRFDVPQSWIRNVMHAELGGQLYVNGQLVTSGVGAMGLMQVMPETYQELEAQYRLGRRSL